ncbi:MAG: repeat containing protein [Cyanobacteria bacterium RYN_339]|nr:repeat containing protein [Cyanobacteria bacterium RYN_339]
MRRRVGLLAVMLTLGACQGNSPVKPASPKPSAASVKPTGTTAPIVAQTLLKQPTTAFTKVTGQVKVDAGYLIGEGGAQLGPDGKALIIANNGGGIVANNGGGLIANNAGNLIANNGGGIISDHGNGLLSDSGASLLASADAGLLGDAGASLLGDAGAGLIGKTKYHLAQAGPALGTALPAGGMVVVALDMATGKAVSLGEDGAGKPVYAVQSNAAGRYELYLPKDLPRNVRLVAVPPGTRNTRLVYSLVTPVQATAERALDEDTALASRFLRGCLVSYLQNELLTHADADASQANPALALFKPLLVEFQDAAKLGGGDKLSPAGARYVAQAVADTVCAYADLAAMQTNSRDTEWKGPVEPAFPVMIEVLRAVNVAAATKLRADGKAFDARPFLVDANMRRAAAGQASYVLAKPGDVGELMFHEYLDAASKRQQEKLRFVFVDLGVPLDQYDRFRAAYSGTFLGLAQLMVSDDQAKAAALATLKASLAVAAAQPAGAVASPTPKPAGALRAVTTLAGAADPGYVDGPLTAARFASPAGLAADDAGNLYVADTNNHRIRKIGADGQVTTLAGGEPGYADGLADKAQFALPRRLLLDQAHQVLYVAEVDKPRIRKITLGEHPAVTTLAGDGTPGFLDGPAAAARFNVPLGMTLDAEGNLYVADNGNNRVRKIAVDGTVTTVLGSGSADGFSIGDPLKSVVHGISEVLLDGASRLLVADQYRVGILKLGASASYNILAGNGWGGTTDGYWVNAQLTYPSGIVSDGDKGFYVLEEIGGRVRRAVPAGPDALTFSTLVAGGGMEEEAFADGPGDKARFAKPLGLAASRDGKKIYVADTHNHRIRLVQE